MIWQDVVFTIGSGLSIGFLAPTLRDASARIPLGTSLPSMAIGLVYGLTFSTLGMSFSALGATASGAMWALIAICRSPTPDRVPATRRERLRLLGSDGRRWMARRWDRTDGVAIEQYVEPDAGDGRTDGPRGGSPQAD